ncbi:nuclear transport factor 2 family protein [Microbacterium sp.]|uniref:nuclear transport factor 2 family protein n=1 Tax=Microbacterium sp. TaxID=51671 RepID=UPI0039E5BE77
MTTTTDTLSANKELVAYVFDQLFSHANAAVIDTHFSPDYVQHSPAAGDGLAGLHGFIAFAKTTFPDSRATVHHLFAEGDLVVVHSNIVAVPQTPGFAAIDIFRVVDGVIVEHWDASSEAPEETLSGNDLYSTLSLPVDAAPDPAADAEVSRDVAVRLVRALGVDHDASAVDDLVAADVVQHDAAIGAGLEGLRDAAKAPGRHDVEITRVIAEGDYVAVHGHWHFADDDGVAVITILRVREGKVVEQWAARQPVPAASANDNGMF